MKLIDLLVQELPKRGGWPEGVGQDVVNWCIKFNIDSFYIDNESSHFVDMAGDRVTRYQYEAALAASQKVEWDGTGMPPVGIEVESAQPGQINWTRFKVIAVDSGVVFGFWSNGVASALDGDRWLFRPIRSEADKKREAALDAIYGAIASAERAHNRSDEADKVYEAIAAGKIPGVKLED